MLLQRTTPLRSTALSCRLPSTTFAAAPFHTSSSISISGGAPSNTSTSPRSQNPTISRQQTIRNLPTQFHTSLITARPGSTTATSTSPSSSSSTISHPSNINGHALTWNRFLQLRRIRRRFNLTAAIASTVLTTIGGVSVISSQDLDSFGASQFGLDPVVVLGIMTAGFAAIGWLIGPVVGNRVFALRYRKDIKDMRLMEKEFYHRIQRHRVDPSNSSYQNPVPDYYGEKIGSVQGYRQWLKDQRAFNKKRQSFM
ncbi:MAG: TIM23 complex component [Cirrosporium novae-zelandiae]|nr:MAG: TIM23 complex component [Cirrosporium novae-zelandiae]